MKSIARINRPYIYIFGSYLITFLIANYVVFDIPLNALRLLAISILTIAGILIGLVATIATSITRISTSQKQFYQGILINESQWLRDWFAVHPLFPDQLETDVKEVLHLIYRHSTIAAASDEEILDKVEKTLFPLPGNWIKAISDAPDNSLVKQSEIDEFMAHLEQIGATVGQIKAAKDRMELGTHFGDVLWSLGFTILLALILILCTGIPSIAQFISGNTYLFALMLIGIAFISVFFLIWFTTRYLRAEAKEIKRVVRR